MAVSLYEYTLEETEYIVGLAKKPKIIINPNMPSPDDIPKLFVNKTSDAVNIATIKKYGTVVNYDAGETIFHENDIGNGLYIILKGEVIVETGNAGEITRLACGDVFGEMSVIDGIERSATVKTVEQAVFFLISTEQFKNAISSEPNLAVKIMTTMSARIRATNNKLDAKEKNEAIVKELKFILKESDDGDESLEALSIDSIL